MKRVIAVIKVIRPLFAFILFLCVILIALAASWLIISINSLPNVIADDTLVAGVDVSGLDYDQALEKVDAKLSEEVSDYRLTIKDSNTNIETLNLDDYISYDSKTAVQDALSQSFAHSGLVRAQLVIDKQFGTYVPEHSEFEVPFNFSTPDIKNTLEELAETSKKDPVDAKRTIEGDSVKIEPGQDGQELDVDKALEDFNAIMQKFEQEKLPDQKDFFIELEYKTSPAQISADSFGRVITVNLSKHKLYLFEGEEIIKTYTIGSGMPGYETPTGLLKITAKRKNPVWINPAPDGWGKNSPEKLGPGPDSPLGLRALNLNRPAIRIHGVSDMSRLGVSRSHGCINMANNDVVELFDLVEVDTPVNVHY
ncbi:MAG: L,D-transpeptidase family protein [Coriobacteriia bacterium]|nr:L,D-transpeptidase family protein [Coriobacteriia bacterium]